MTETQSITLNQDIVFPKGTVIQGLWADDSPIGYNILKVKGTEFKKIKRHIINELFTWDYMYIENYKDGSKLLDPHPIPVIFDALWDKAIELGNKIIVEK